MNHLVLLLLSVISIQTNPTQGLRFKDNTHPIDERTSYNVFNDQSVEFSGHFSIEFDLSLYSTHQIGYILRIKDAKNSTIYNLFFEEQNDDLVFKFNEEGVSSLVTARLDKDILNKARWIHVGISFNLQQNQLKLSIQDQIHTIEKLDLPDTYHPTVIFGKSDYIIEVPSFAIRDLSIGDGNKYTFQLSEGRGKAVHDEEGNAIGWVENPDWLINDAYFWRLKHSFKSRAVAGSCHNPTNNEIYYFNKDTLFQYNTKTDRANVIVLKNECPINFTTGTSFIDAENNKLYVYEVYTNTNEPSVASLDLTNFEWKTESYDKLQKRLFHHGRFFDAKRDRFVLFGGFGDKRYSNSFYSYSTTTNDWEEILTDLEGDFISPRYFASISYVEQEQSIYIFGGMGNKSGDQIVGRKYMHDLYEVNLETKKTSKLWDIPWDNIEMVPVRSMVIMDSSFYTLCYPEHYTDSFLKLYQYSLQDGVFKILGDSIPIHSDKMNTNANIYYSSSEQTLYALVQEFEDDDVASQLKIYSIAFPAVTVDKLMTQVKSDSSVATKLITLLLSMLFIVVLGYLLLKKRAKSIKQRGSREMSEKGTSPTDEHKPNSIFLFGNFTVFDRSGKDISYMFSSRLTEMFCLILQHSVKEGINSKNLSNMLWPDKEGEKLKNSRGVTINNLRKVLSELDGIELIYENGYYRLTHTPELHCDYINFVEILSSNKLAEHQESFAQIVSRGKFLNNLNEPIFDSFKTSTERKLEPILIVEIEKSYSSGLFLMSIALSKALFEIDPLSDVALEYQIKSLQNMERRDEALIKYNEFLIRYRKVMKQDYPKQFKI